jgi:hypothetical protein
MFVELWRAKGVPFGSGLFVLTQASSRLLSWLPCTASWESDAAERVSKLAEMAELLSEAQPPDSFEELRDHSEKHEKFLNLDNGPFGRFRPDRALWGLWLTTGLPFAQRQTDEPMHEYVKRNADAYRTFVEKNKELSEESIHRMGMESAVNAFGSPLWYMTLQYLKKQGGLRYYDYVIDVRSTPTTALEVVPLACQSSYQRMSDALPNSTRR